MSRAMKVIWVATLLAFVGGCSTYKTLPPFHLPDEGPAAADVSGAVEKGDEIRVTVRSGGRAQGRVLEVTPQEIVMRISDHDKLFANHDLEGEDVRIGADALRAVDKRKFSVGKTLVLLGVIALPIVAIGVGMESVDMSMDSGNWGTVGPY